MTFITAAVAVSAAGLLLLAAGVAGVTAGSAVGPAVGRAGKLSVEVGAELGTENGDLMTGRVNCRVCPGLGGAGLGMAPMPDDCWR